MLDFGNFVAGPYATMLMADLGATVIKVETIGDQMMQASAGWEVASAGEGNVPQWLRFGMTDHFCALSSLLATLLGVRQQRRSSAWPARCSA